MEGCLSCRQRWLRFDALVCVYCWLLEVCLSLVPFVGLLCVFSVGSSLLQPA